MKKVARALIVLDPMGSSQGTDEEEFAGIVELYDRLHGVRLEATRTDVFDPAEAEGVELIVFDWGGMALGNDLMGHQIRALTRWSADHPSVLVVIRSMLSWSYLETEVRDEQLPDLATMIQDKGGLNLPEWWTGHLRNEKA